MTSHSASRYGRLTKILHWIVFVLMLNQFVVATAMLNIPEWDTAAGLSRDTLYEWHKSVGLVLLLVAIVRYVWRRTAPLPDWAPNLSAGEKRAIHGIERTLYGCMFLMPVSGFVFVMAGNYPVKFFGIWNLPNVIGSHATLSLVAQWAHELTAGLLVAALLGHWGLGIRHQRTHRDRYLHRMLPFTHQQ